MKLKGMSRRDRCDLVGRRAARLDRDQAAAAWWLLAGRLEGMGEMDVPKFNDLLSAIRKATIGGALAANRTLSPLPSTARPGTLFKLS